MEQHRTDLTIDEYAQQIAAGEAPPELQYAAPGGKTRRPRWIVGVLGGSEQRGRWRLGSRLRVIAILGGVKLDVGQAEPEAAETRISVLALFGGVEILAPPGVPVELTGLSLLGGKTDERSRGPRLPGSPVVHVRAFCIFGGVTVKGD